MIERGDGATRRARGVHQRSRAVGDLIDRLEAEGDVDLGTDFGCEDQRALGEP